MSQARTGEVAALDGPIRGAPSVDRSTVEAPPAGRPPPARARDSWARRLPLLPALVYTIVLTQVPFAATVVLSFVEWNAFRPGERGFAGLANYRTVLGDPETRGAIVTTALLTATVVIASLVLGLVLALLLNRAFRGRAVARTLLITPFLIVPVAAAPAWKHLLLNPAFGLFNGLLEGLGNLVGVDAPQVDWVSRFPLLAIELSLIWQWTPFMMLILLAGLQSLPKDSLEAASLDGADGWQQFRHIVLPHLRRYIELGGLLGAIYVVQVFDHVFTITAGGLDTANLPYAIYQEFFVAKDYGAAAAMGVIVVLGSLVIAMFALRTVSSLLKDET